MLEHTADDRYAPRPDLSGAWLDLVTERDLLRAAVESGLEALVVVSRDGRMLSMNHQFIEMWGIPEEVLRGGDDAVALKAVTEKLLDPRGFIERVQELYGAMNVSARDEVHMLDGRILDRWGTPLHGVDGDYLGRAWYFRDVTAERIAAREAVESGERFARLARTLQESLLPPLLPDVPGLEIAARYLPAGTGVDVVGDFYDVFQTSATGWAVTIGDVCGHGVEAATVTALARYTIRAGAVAVRSPSEVLRLLNSAMRRQHPDSERFVTAVYVALEPQEGGIGASLALGGHPPALRRRAHGDVEAVGATGTVLGVLDEVELHDTSLVLRPGDTLLLHTDGVTEAHRGDELYGDERLRRLLERAPGGAAEIAAAVEQDVLAYADGGVHDDIAVVVLRVPPG